MALSSGVASHSVRMDPLLYEYSLVACSSLRLVDSSQQTPLLQARRAANNMICDKSAHALKLFAVLTP